MDEPFPPSTTTPPPHPPNQARAIWIAALALPLVIVVSGSIIGFLCWRRLRVTHNPSSPPWKQLEESPASSSENHGHRRPELRLPPPTRPLRRPLVLLARTTSSHLSPSPRVHMAQKSSPPPPTLAFPSVSTKMTRNGTRVLTKKKPTWPPSISLPLELNTFSHLPQPQGHERGGNADHHSEANEVGLSRGLSKVSGYHSQSNHPDPYSPSTRLALSRLVEEAQGTRSSWHEGGDDQEEELDYQMSNLSPQAHLRHPRHRPCAKSLSSRSISEYSHLTMGATTLGNLIDQEVVRFSSFSPTPNDHLEIPPFATSTTRPLDLTRRRQSAPSTDQYSLEQERFSFVPFPRLPPLSLRSNLDLPTTPSTAYYQHGRGGEGREEDELRLPPPLPYDGFTTKGSRVPPPEWFGQTKETVEGRDSQDMRLGGEGEDGRDESLIEWRRGKTEERRKERELALKA
ncbi:hypothetical protein JCM16303_003561 [Sporobolomyces ruberrimus]